MDFNKIKVVEIMNIEELIINYGYEDGAAIGDKVRIYEKGDEVKDPTTGKILGTLDVIKDDLEITIVYPKFSICRKIIRKTSSILSPLANLALGSVSLDALPLNVLESDISGRYLPSPGPIKVNDSVLIL